MSQARVSGITERLLSGQDDGNGIHLQDYIAGGQYLADVAVDGQQTAAAMMTQNMIAAGINTLYKNSQVYIVASPTNNCNGDTRGPQETKFCRDGDNTVYYAFQ
jgi:hypothetical protein